MDEEIFDIGAEDKDLEDTFVAWLAESEPYHKELLTKQKESFEYYIGNQTRRNEVPAYGTDTVENRIFESVETIVPIATSRPHHFLVLPGSENELSLARAEKTQKVLTRLYDRIGMQEKLEDVARHIMLFRFGVMKWVWSKELDDVDVEVKDPRLVLFPKLKVRAKRLPYMIEIQEYVRADFETEFPEVDVDELKLETPSDGGSSGSARKRVYRVYEVWTPEMTAWFSNKKLIKKIANPYFDFEGETVKRYDEITGKRKKTLKFFNHLDRPTIPYVIFTTFSLMDAPVGVTSLTEVAIPIQDSINLQKRAIIDNLRSMGNGQVYVDNDAMSQEESDNITSEPGAVIRGDGVASQNKIRREAGVSIPNAHFSNLTHSESVLENLFGVHGATRGSAGADTLGQDLISRQQDFSRIDLITRVLNRGVAEVANGVVQLLKMFYTEDHLIKMVGEENAIEFIRFNRNDIDDYIELDVKSGEVLPMDKMSLRTEAVQLWQLGALDPVTLFERLEFQNPEKAAERLQAWKAGQLTQETMQKIQEIEASARFGGAAGPGGSEKSKEPGAVETPQNVIQRATSGLGGSAPIAGTPKM